MTVATLKSTVKLRKNTEGCLRSFWYFFKGFSASVARHAAV